MARLHTLSPHRHLLWLAALLLALVACSAPKQQALPAGATVLVLGDSISAGYGLTPEQAWPAKLAAATGWNVVNAGVSGDTTAGGRERLPGLLEEHKPAAVMIELGGNDMLRKVPPAETRANLEGMIDMVRNAGAVPILLATPRFSVMGAAIGSLSAAEVYPELAEAQKVFLIEDAIPDVLSDKELKLDALHPDEAGHVELAKKVAEELKAGGFVR